MVAYNIRRTLTTAVCEEFCVPPCTRQLILGGGIRERPQYKIMQMVEGSLVYLLFKCYI